MSDSPFTTIGDEPVEARIVAWVLGEASAFEAAELERLCDERPELMIFKRRMLALHGLLADAEKPQTDESWKLSPEKRKAVEEILGDEKPIRLEVVKEKRIRRNGRRAFLAIAACVLLTLFITRLQPWKQTSEAIIEVKPRMAGSSPLGSEMGESSGAGRMTPQFFGTESEKIKSRGTLEKVAENLDLAKRWDMDKEQVVEKLKDSIKTENVRGTDLLKIQVRQSDKKDADEIAREVAYAYKDYREQIEKHDVDRQLAELNKAVRDQEDKVEERRKVLATITRTKGQLGANDSREEAIKRGLDAQDYVDARREFETDQQLLQTMKLKQMAETISRKASSESVVVHEVPEAGAMSSKSAFDSLASNTAARTQRLETELPKELIEGTPKPMNVPNLESPVSGPAGSATWSMAARSRRSGEADERNAEPASPAAPPMPSAAPSERHGGELAQREPRPRIIAQPSQPAAKVAPASNADPFADEGASTSHLAARQLKTKTGSGALSLNSGGVIPADELISGGDRDGSGPIEKDNIAGNRRNDAGSAGEKAPKAREAPVDMPVLGSLFTEDDKSDRSLGSDNYDSNGWLSGTNTYSGGTAVTGGALGIGGGGSGGFAEAAPEAQPAASGKVDGDASVSFNAELNQDGQKKDEGKLVGGIEIVGGSKFELKPGNTTEYFLRGADLAKDKAATPDDAEALAKAIREQEDKVEERRKVLASIVRHKEIISKAQDSFYNQGGVDEDLGARNALQTYHEIEQEKMQLESQISSMLKYDSDQLMTYAGGLNLPDNIIRELYPKYQEAKRQLDGLKIKGLGDRHPTVQDTVDQVENMKRQLDEGVVTLRATLQAQLDLATNRLKSLEVAKNDTREEAIKRRLDAPHYVDTKEELEKDQELLQQMKLKLMAASKKMQEPSKVDLTKLMEEIPTTQEPYSTFSLNISDASFQVAQAALAKGERPDPAGIKVEQFYNAVDYGDPAPSVNEPVAVNIEQSAHPVIPGRNLVRIALKTAAAGRCASQPLRLTLLVDQSGSMVREDRRAAMDKALAGLSELLTKNDLVTVIGFSRTPRLLADGMSGDKAGKLAELVNQAASEGGTNLEEAIKLGEQLADRRKLAGAQNRIVLFTDGAANLGNADPARLAEHVKQLRQKGIAFDIAGIAADGLNDELLGELARNGNGRYYVVGKGADANFAKQLAGAFRPAAENVKVQVRFNPERVGRYKLIGFEKDRLKTEDFRNDKVDAAELAAEEAGVAIYQVEPLPEGHGELGEVSVRFRDTASNEMVERSWTISHNSGAPAIDRATPSMQLATLAMLAGEKLKGGPLAEAVDFRQLTAPAANVKQFYGNAGRVGEVLRMVEMLK